MGEQENELSPGSLWDFAKANLIRQEAEADAIYELGTKKLDGNQDSKAAECFQEAAGRGHAQAHFNLGLMFTLGRSLERNGKKAAIHFTESAKLGNRNAQAVLAWMYFRGEGVVCNKKEAAGWFEKAAGKGHMFSQGQLAMIYLHGLGLPQDFSKAAKWCWDASKQGFEYASDILETNSRLYSSCLENLLEVATPIKAKAEQGDPDSQFELGCMYEKGEGVARNKMLAAKWYNQSSKQGNAKAMASLAWLLWHLSEEELESELGYWMAKHFREGELEDLINDGLKAEAIQWCKKAAGMGEPEAMRNLSDMLLWGAGEEEPADMKEANAWLLKAAEAGDLTSQTTLAAKYFLGEGPLGEEIPKDTKKAATWLIKAAEQGNDLSCLWLGQLYRDGDGVERDTKQALQLFAKWTITGENSNNEIGKLLRSEKDPSLLKQAEWILSGEALQGNEFAQLALGTIYFDGVGTPKDFTKAAKWLEMAAGQGCPDAITKVASCYGKGGYGLLKDPVKAYAWLKIASWDDGSEARLRMLTRNMSGEDIKKAEELVSKLERDCPTIR